MKYPTFFEGVTVALALSLAGGALYAALTSVFAGGGVLRLLIAGIALAYVVYLLGRSRERMGKITTFAVWTAVTLALW